MAPIVVDPYALSGAGASVSAVGDGLSAAVSVLAGSFDANTGADSAGAVFGRQYVSAADAILKSVSAGVNACRNVGYGIGVSAANYSRADADSDISGRSQPLASPPCPAPVSAPGSPTVLGGGVAVPALWFVVQAFVGDLWPSGDPAGMRQAAAAWRVFEVSLRDVGVDVSGPDTTVGAQRIGEGAQIQGALREIGTGLSEAASQCEQLASGLEGFAAGVEHTQQAIRDLLGKLGSIGGVVGTFFEFVRGHGEEEFHRIVADIRTVLHHLKAEADAKKELAAQGLAALDSGALRLQAWADREFVDLFGERVGNAFATQFNNTVDSAEGGVRWLASTADGVAALDPTRFAYDPEGAKQTWQGLADFANVLSNPVGAYHADPEKMQTILNGLARTDEWSKGRPALALTENALDLLTLGVPGLGEAGAAGDAASVAGRLSRAGQDRRSGRRGREGGRQSRRDQPGCRRFDQHRQGHRRDHRETRRHRRQTRHRRAAASRRPSGFAGQACRSGSGVADQTTYARRCSSGRLPWNQEPCIGCDGGKFRCYRAPRADRCRIGRWRERAPRRCEQVERRK